MNTQSHYDLTMAALQAYKGDNYSRAKAAFRGLSPEKMSSHYGESGITRQEILDTYKRHEDAVDAAMRWLTQKVSG
jgi:hypothetical protein